MLPVRTIYEAHLSTDHILFSVTFYSKYRHWQFPVQITELNISTKHGRHEENEKIYLFVGFYAKFSHCGYETLKTTATGN
jgi:hypothetical protein